MFFNLTRFIFSIIHLISCLIVGQYYINGVLVLNTQNDISLHITSVSCSVLFDEHALEKRIPCIKYRWFGVPFNKSVMQYLHWSFTQKTSLLIYNQINELRVNKVVMLNFKLVLDHCVTPYLGFNLSRICVRINIVIW